MIFGADGAFAKAVSKRSSSSTSSTRIASIHHSALFHQAETSWLTAADRGPNAFAGLLRILVRMFAT